MSSSDQQYTSSSDESDSDSICDDSDLIDDSCDVTTAAGDGDGYVARASGYFEAMGRLNLLLQRQRELLSNAETTHAHTRDAAAACGTMVRQTGCASLVAHQRSLLTEATRDHRRAVKACTHVRLMMIRARRAAATSARIASAASRVAQAAAAAADSAARQAIVRLRFRIMYDQAVLHRAVSLSSQQA